MPSILDLLLFHLFGLLKYNMAQQTAVEWLVEQYANENYGIEVYEQAKQIEKEQIIKAAALVLLLVTNLF